MNDTDVLVVGGGATGVGTARDLALRGLDVTLVERNGLGSGTSGRSHGVVHSGARYAEADPVDARECIEENRILRSIAGAAIDETGGLFVQLADDDPAYFEQKRAACEECDIPVEMLSVSRANDLAPGLSEAVERVMHVPDAVVYPSRLIAANAAAAQQHGATIHLHAPLTDLTTERGQVVEATLGGTVDQRITPEYVVNAAGAWAGKVAALAGVSVGMQPTRGVMVSVEYNTLGPVLNRCRDPDDGDIIVPHDSEAVLGTTSVAVDDPDEYDTADWEIERSVEECAAMLPAVTDRPTVRTWWGVRPLYEPTAEDTDGRDISRGFARIDHSTAGLDNMTTIVGGKLTTYRRMAQKTADAVCEQFGIEADCETARRSLPGSDNPDQLDRYADNFDCDNPTDRDVVHG